MPILSRSNTTVSPFLVLSGRHSMDVNADKQPSSAFSTSERTSSDPYDEHSSSRESPLGKSYVVGVPTRRAES
jgi:hypothetical protein